MSTSVTVRDAEHAVRLLEAVSDSKPPGYVYPAAAAGETCRYFDYLDEKGPDGEPLLTPGCIIGHVLVRLGYTPSDMDGSGDPVEDSNPAGLVEQGVIEAPPVVGWIFAAAQTVQDSGASWGTAVIAARAAREAFEAGRVTGAQQQIAAGVTGA